MFCSRVCALASYTTGIALDGTWTMAIFATVRWLWWLPLVIDPGCLLLLVTTALFWLRGGFTANS
jgi:hypothetical protein